jgi:hypothetical protein
MALMDTSGKKRIVLKVLEMGESSLRFLDNKGTILRSFTPSQKFP